MGPKLFKYLWQSQKSCQARVNLIQRALCEYTIKKIPKKAQINNRYKGGPILLLGYWNLLKCLPIYEILINNAPSWTRKQTPCFIIFYIFPLPRYLTAGGLLCRFLIDFKLLRFFFIEARGRLRHKLGVWSSNEAANQNRGRVKTFDQNML